MKEEQFDIRRDRIQKEHQELVLKKNEALFSTNGIYERYKNPILTRDHVPIAWRYDLNYKALARATNITASYSIYPGQRLILAEKAPPKAKPKAKRVVKTTPTPKPVKKVVSKPKSSPKKVVRSKKQAPVVAKSTAPEGTKKTSTWVWPTHGKLISTFQSGNGLHKGVDIQGQLAQPVISASAGKVVYSGDGLRGYGKLIIIKHNEKFLSAYAHNRRLLVNEGAVVKMGQKIAEMGSTGTDTVKLHFEIRYDGKPVNPLKYLPKRP